MLLRSIHRRGCAVHVLGRSRRSIRRLRRATCWCLLVFTRNVLPRVRAFGLATVNSLQMGTDISSFLFTAEPQTRLYWA